MERSKLPPGGRPGWWRVNEWRRCVTLRKIWSFGLILSVALLSLMGSLHWRIVEGQNLTSGSNNGGLEEYTWSCSDADAVEWLYSLHEAKVISHNGEPADIAHLGRWFQMNFRKYIVNIYDRFKAIRNRKKDRVPFMRRLFEGLEKRMDQADGRYD